MKKLRHRACAGIPWTIAWAHSGTCQSAVGVPGKREYGRAGRGQEGMRSGFPSRLCLPLHAVGRWDVLDPERALEVTFSPLRLRFSRLFRQYTVEKDIKKQPYNSKFHWKHVVSAILILKVCDKVTLDMCENKAELWNVSLLDVRLSSLGVSEGCEVYCAECVWSLCVLIKIPNHVCKLLKMAFKNNEQGKWTFGWLTYFCWWGPFPFS